MKAEAEGRGGGLRCVCEKRKQGPWLKPWKMLTVLEADGGRGAREGAAEEFFGEGISGTV